MFYSAAQDAVRTRPAAARPGSDSGRPGQEATSRQRDFPGEGLPSQGLAGDAIGTGNPTQRLSRLNDGGRDRDGGGTFPGGALIESSSAKLDNQTSGDNH